MMARMYKRLIALLLTLSLMASIAALPVAAEGSDTPPVTVTVDITNDNGDVIGQKTTEITTNTSDTASSYKENTTVESSWTTQETETTVTPPVTEGGVTTEVSNQVTTDVSGSETSTGSVNSNKNTGVQIYSGSNSGSETTDISDDTTTTITTEDTLLDTRKEDPKTTIDNSLDEGSWSDPTLTGSTGWVLTGGEDQDFEKVGTSTPTPSGSAPIDVDENPLEDKDVTLNFKAPTGETGVSEDSQTLSISLADALANDIHYQDGDVVDGYVVSLNKDSKGNLLGYTLTKYENQTNNTLDQAPIVPDQKDADVPSAPAGGSATSFAPTDPTTGQPYQPCENEPIWENGEQVGVRTVVQTTDPATGRVSYTVTEERWEIRENTTDKLSDVTPTDIPTGSFTPPEKPIAPEPVTVGGLTTTVTVTETQDAHGNPGYITTTVITDEDGNEVSMESSTIYGTYTSHSANVERFPDYDKVTTTTVTTVEGILNTQNSTKTNTGTKTAVNTRDVTEEIYELVQTDDGLFFLFEGKMYEVRAITGTNPLVPSQGDVNMTSLKPSVTELAKVPSGDGKISETTDLRNPHYNDYVDVNSTTIGTQYDYKYIGYGLESSITADTYKTYGTLVHQFKLKDKSGNEFYALCADFATTANRGADYSMTNVYDATYYSKENAKKINAIAANGFWGTDSGVGSLENVIAFLKAHSDLDDTLLNGLTEGEALTATQAAIWYYGDSKDSSGLNSTSASSGYQYTGGSYYDEEYNRYWYYMYTDTDEDQRINALYQALINLDPNTVTDTSTELLTTKNYATSAQLVIKDQVTDITNGTGTTGVQQTDSQGNDLYLADLSFTLDVKKSDLTGNLVVTVVDENGNKLAEEQIATTDSNLLGKLLAPASTTDSTTTYTLRNLQLPEGVKFDLNLSGLQNLEQGVYLYSAAVYSESQTFVGIASGTHDVNLSVQMEFSVTDPKAEIQHSTDRYQQMEVDTQTFTKVDTLKEEKKDVRTNQTVMVTTDTYGTAVRTNLMEKDTHKERMWRNKYLYELVAVSGDDGNEDKDKDKFGKDSAKDEDADRANAPRTGDISGLWAAISLLSLGGMHLLSRKRKEEEA